MRPQIRKWALTAHITASVGWLGAVAGFLVLGIAGLRSQDADIVRGAYLAMDVIGRFLIVPLSLAALVTGLVQAFGTEWGLLRYYWVFVKYVLTLLAAVALLLHQFTAVAAAANRVLASAPGTLPDVGRLGTQLVGDAALAVLLLILVTTLSVFKPWGPTLRGRRLRQDRRDRVATGSAASSTSLALDADGERLEAGLPFGLKVFIALIGVMALVGFVVKHLAGGGFAAHGH